MNNSTKYLEFLGYNWNIKDQIKESGQPITLEELRLKELVRIRKNIVFFFYSLVIPPVLYGIVLLFIAAA